MEVIRTDESIKSANSVMKSKGYKIKKSKHSSAIRIYIHRRSHERIMYVFTKKIKNKLPTVY